MLAMLAVLRVAPLLPSPTLRAAGLKCRVLAINRSPVTNPAPAETVFPLAELDRMLPLCDTVLISCGLGPKTRGLIDARRLALMKQGAC